MEGSKCFFLFFFYNLSYFFTCLVAASRLFYVVGRPFSFPVFWATFLFICVGSVSHGPGRINLRAHTSKMGLPFRLPSQHVTDLFEIFPTLRGCLSARVYAYFNIFCYLLFPVLVYLFLSACLAGWFDGWLGDN